MKVFVTGATGFIGRRLACRLINDGHKVIALVRDNNHFLPDGVDTVCGDILKPVSLGTSGQGCSRLYHLAAKISFDTRKREELMDVNARGTLNVISAARKWNVERTIILSSACTMGLTHDKDIILKEDSPLNIDFISHNPYMESKLEAERFAIESSKGMCVVIVNPSTVYGPGDRTLNSGTLIKSVARLPLIPVPPGGSNTVDVDDVVEGILAAGERGQSGQRYILGGANLTFKEIILTISEVIKRRPVFLPVPGWVRMPVSAVVNAWGSLSRSRFLTVQVIDDMFGFKYFSNEKAKNELGWIPRFTFRESVERAWSFYRKDGLI